MLEPPHNVAAAHRIAPEGPIVQSPDGDSYRDPAPGSIPFKSCNSRRKLSATSPSPPTHIADPVSAGYLQSRYIDLCEMFVESHLPAMSTELLYDRQHPRRAASPATVLWRPDDNRRTTRRISSRLATHSRPQRPAGSQMRWVGRSVALPASKESVSTARPTTLVSSSRY